uniref:Subtilase family protein n=1 Tax=Candidatus Kentrum sp. TUN TaxID=2126343 RepID=A0A451A9G8_9GAMM|nr:MAG: Subtilase family protein [Candidatus Kentron sp. TUN]
MPESYPHLPLQREAPINEKRSGKPPRVQVPEDTHGHGRGLQQKLAQAKEQAASDVGGFDERRVFKFEVQEAINPDDLRKLSGVRGKTDTEIEFISQEGKTVVVGFASDAALAQFEARLATMADDDAKLTNKQLFYALQDVGGWSPEDRKGWALEKQGLPDKDTFLLDVELWPLEDSRERDLEWAAFEMWLAQEGIEKKDQVKQPGLTLYRVQCNANQAKQLLCHRDVRSVDLPPSFGLEQAVVFQDIQKFPAITDPGDQAPGVVVLDSGLATGHPLLGAAVGDSQSFLPEEEEAADENGHGTHVAGLALYGDFESSLRSGAFVPMLRLFSGRILDKDNENNTGFVENHIEKAVRYFAEAYHCRVFNLSFGDANKPYLGGHLKGLSLTLDTLSRELGVLFVVSAGNYRIGEDSPEGLAWRDNYPDYLLDEVWRIIEPAPALNVLTVGSLARHNQTWNSQRYPSDPSEIPIAQPNQPSPFTRSGHSVDGAIKPELVTHGGNWALNARAGHALMDRVAGLGVVSTNHRFVDGYPFTVDSGTSMAAPQVAHLAASIFREHPKASANLLRALLCAHAVMPEASQDLISQATSPFTTERKSIYSERKKIWEARREGRAYSSERLDKLNARYQELEDLLNQYHCICGYGQVDETALRRSLENAVTLIANGPIENRRHHFYEIPIPNEFTSGGKRRLREIAVALAYTPVVRSTRIKYRATRIDFRLVTAPGLIQVTTMFNKATEENDYENIPEFKKGVIGQAARSKGTVQADCWRFSQFNKSSKLRNQKLFVVITRNDFPWGENLCATEEDYALVVSLRDWENEEARLYSQIKTQLDARLPLRIKGRAVVS